MPLERKAFETQADSLSATGLTVARGGRLVFKGVDFSIGAGDALIVKGPNGAGKSTLIRTVAGLVPVLSGTMTLSVAGKPVDRPDVGIHLAYVGLQDGTKPTMTAEETLLFWRSVHGHVPDAAIITSALDRFGLSRRSALQTRYFSTGQKRRLALARLIAVPAPVWLLDEPTVGLDTDAVAALEDCLAAHRERGGLTILATHTPIGLTGSPLTVDLADHQPDAETALAALTGEDLAEDAS